MIKNNKKLKKIILAILIIFILLFVILIVITNKAEEKHLNSQIEIETQEENAKQIERDVIIDKLAEMEERDRIEYYFSRFIKAIEAKNYEKAYAMLYGEFKENYFPDLSSFEEYSKKTFPKFFSVKHDNIERNGDVYVLFITISDSLSSSDIGKEMKIVVKENELNDFLMSFSVI